MVKPRLDDPLTADQVRTLLDYSPKTGVFVWKQRRAWRPEWNTRYAGTIAGTPHARGYVQIAVNGELYLAHRLAFLWMTGEWPPIEIDHRDGNRSNNAWVNLRAVTVSQQRMNSATRYDNSSGHKGVTFDKRRGVWYARILVEYRVHHLGSFATKEQAAAAYADAARRLHGRYVRN